MRCKQANSQSLANSESTSRPSRSSPSTHDTSSGSAPTASCPSSTAETSSRRTSAASQRTAPSTRAWLSTPWTTFLWASASALAARQRAGDSIPPVLCVSDRPTAASTCATKIPCFSLARGMEFTGDYFRSVECNTSWSLWALVAMIFYNSAWRLKDEDMFGGGFVRDKKVVS